MELELATSQELIEELMHRETFTGVVVEVTKPDSTVNVGLYRSVHMNNLTTINVLGLGVQALSKFFLPEEYTQSEGDHDRPAPE